MAKKVMQMPEEKEEELQAKKFSGPFRSLDWRVNPLLPALRQFYEPRFGHDLNSVRIHADQAADELALQLNARSFTSRQNIVFASGQYGPDSMSGSYLLAHKLAHVIQPGGGNKVNARSIPLVQRKRRPKNKYDPFFYMLTLSKASNIFNHALQRLTSNSMVVKSYDSTIPWVFCPNPRHSNALSKQDILLSNQTNTHITSAADNNRPRRYRYMRGKRGRRLIPKMVARPSLKSYLLRFMPALGINLENFPTGEYVTWLSHSYHLNNKLYIDKCNLFVFHVLHQAGHDCLERTGLYPSQRHIVTRTNELGFKKVPHSKVMPGTIFADGDHTGIVYSGIKNGRFDVIDYYGSLKLREGYKAREYKFFMMQ